MDLREPIIVRAGEAFIAVPGRKRVQEEEGDMAKGSLNPGLYDPRRGGQAIRTQSLDLTASRASRPAPIILPSISSNPAPGRFGPTLPVLPSALIPCCSSSPISTSDSSRIVPVHGEVIQFHANFLCVETFHAEVGCSGVLFNDPYGIPVVALDERAKPEVTNLIERIRQEQDESDLAYGEVMLAYLKVLLILATRLKSPKAGACGPGAVDLRHPILAKLRDLIEENYRTLHSPADYAKRLHLTPKTLGRIVREHLGTTPTDLIRNRILIHAKWQLLHTLKPVKEIARELGFSDELYFSRLFKKATGYSPTFFREFETEIRGGSNLSMFSAHAPILHSAAATDT